MKIISLLLFAIISINLNANENKSTLERVIKLEVQVKQLVKSIDNKSSLLKEKQGIFIEQEKRLSYLEKECAKGVQTIDKKMSTMDEEFRGLYSKANYGIITISIALILAILFICKMLNRSLAPLEKNYKSQIEAITADAERRINAIIGEADTNIRKYQTKIDNNGTTSDDETNNPTISNPF